MRKSMINIQAVYGKYDELIAEFGEQEIQEQISCLLLRGDVLYNILQSKFGNEDVDNAIRLSEHPECLAGIPYDYRAFRGLMGYVARLAISNGLCFVAAPIVKCQEDPYTITMVDWEIALISPNGKPYTEVLD